jgi:alkyl sulfatase BDS1-like metallo-beta-lactamase superfamily hydrolase
LAAYLSQAWLDRAVELAASVPGEPGVAIRIQQVLTGGPDGEVKYWTVIHDGRTVEQRLGQTDDPDVTLTSTYADSLAVQHGELDVSVAFMQGRLKVAGDMAKVLQLLPLSGRPEWQQAQAALAAETEF